MHTSGRHGNTWWPLGLLVGLFLFVPLQGQAQGTVLTLDSTSRFWIQGEATTHSFTCTVDRVEAKARIVTSQDTSAASATPEQTEVLVTVPVRAFDCGNSRMTADLKETLGAEEHPTIRFELIDASVGTETDTSARWRPVEVLGPLTISGTKRLMRIEAAGRALGTDHFRVRGCKPIRMTYFGIEPPTKAFGLIRVKNRVEVQFDLLARSTSATGPSPFQAPSVDRRPSCEE